MSKIIEAGNLPAGEVVYLKQDWLGWRVVEPVVDPTTKKFIWKNFLSKRGFVALAILLILLFFAFLAFKEQFANYQAIVKNPCSFCKDCQAQCREVISGIQFKQSPMEIKLPTLNITT